MSCAQEIQLLGCLCMVLAVLLMAAISAALVAILEMRRMRIIAAARDPLWDAHEDDAMLPGQRGLIARLRRWGVA